MAISSSGVITGTPSSAGTSTWTIQVTDSAAHSSSKGFSFTDIPVTGEAVTVAATSINQGGTDQATSTTTFSAGGHTTQTLNTTAGGSGIGTPSMFAATPTGQIGSTPLTTTVNIAANNLICREMREAENITGVFSPTDSASNTYTQAGTNNISYGTHTLAVFCDSTSNAVTSTSFTYSPSPSGSTMSEIIAAATGLLTSGYLDGTPAQEFLTGTNMTSLPSNNGLTTTNANDLLLYCVDAGTSTTGWTAPVGWTIPSGGSNARQACAYLITSATGTFNPTMTWTGASAAAGGFLVALKGSAAQAGASWVSNNNPPCTINSNGLITGIAQGTCTVTGTVQGHNGTSPTVTVNASSDTSLIITPPSATCPVGGSQQFTAKGNVSGTDFTSTATWSTSDSTKATVSGGLAQCIAQTTGTPVTITAQH